MSRPVHGLERVWLAADRVVPPFVNQLVVEGAGTLDPIAWSTAVATAARAHPCLSVRLRGAGRWARWDRDGAPPRVRTVVAPEWDGTGGAGATFLRDRLDPDTGPVVEVLLVEGPTPRVVFRSHHAVVDGRAARHFAEDVARALRGAAVQGAAEVGAEVTDVSVAERVFPGRTAAIAGAEPKPVPWGLPPGPPTWTRVDAECDPRNLLARVLRALGDIAGVDRPLRASVPVDLATRAGLAPVDANLTGIARVHVAPGAGPDAVRDAVERTIPEAGAALRLAHRLRDVPLAWLAQAGRAGARRLAERGLADEDVTVSNLGRADLRALSGPNFEARGCFWIPPAGPGNPLFVSMSGNTHTVTFCATACTSDTERLTSLLHDAVARLRAG